MWLSIREKNLNDEEMLKEIQKEIQNQEILLQGYQQVKIVQYCDSGLFVLPTKCVRQQF